MPEVINNLFGFVRIFAPPAGMSTEIKPRESLKLARMTGARMK